MRGKTRGLARDIMVERDGMTESKRPEVTMVMFGPAKSGVDHESAGGTNGVLDRIFGDSVVMMGAHATVLDPLALEGELSA